MNNEDKVILDLCGGTGAWSKFYKDAGYDVRNITLPDYDVRTYRPPNSVYGILAAPPCPHFSFCRTNARLPRDLRGAFYIAHHCLRIIWECQYRLDSDVQKYSPLKFWALELEFHPYEYGDNYKKRTYLWGWFNTPPKDPIDCDKPKFDMLLTKEIHPEYYGKLTREERRAITPAGFAKAFYEANK